MEMNKERWIGLAAIILIVVGVVFLRSRNREELAENGLNGEGVEIEERASEFAKQLGVVLPDDVEKASLADVSGGESTGIATRKLEDGKFMHSVLAALPEPETGSWYEGWIVREDPFNVVYTGKMRMAKGGFVVEFTSAEDLSDHSQVVVTVERLDDKRPEIHVLEGDF